MTTHALKNLIAGLPSEPGIYRFTDARKKDLYIGKATNLKNRVGSYLKTEDGRIVKMIESAQSLEFISTESEIEALILESQLIKQFRPPFNIMLRDDKQYFYVGFTKDIFPRIFLTHQPHTFKYLNIEISNFIGPFTDGNTLKSTLRFLRRIFPYCTCKKPHNNFCLNYHIGKCPGFCCLKKPTTNNRRLTTYNKNIRAIKEISYRKNIKAVKDILNGKRASLIKKLEKEMGQLAKNEELEKAIELRNKISDLKRIFENAMIIKNSEIMKNQHSELKSLLKLQKQIIRIEGYDVSNIQGVHATGSMVTFINGRPDKNFYRKFKIKNLKLKIAGGNDTGMLGEILERRLKHEEWPLPDLILIDGGKGQLSVALKVISNFKFLISTEIPGSAREPSPSKQIPVIALTKNKKHIGEKVYISGRKYPLPLTKLPPTDRNLLLAIDSEAHRFAIGYYRKLHAKSLK